MKAKIFYNVINMLKSTTDELVIHSGDTNTIYIESDISYTIVFKNEDIILEQGSYTIVYSNLLRLLRSGNDTTFAMNGDSDGLEIILSKSGKTSFIDCPYVYSNIYKEFASIDISCMNVGIVDFKQTCKTLCNSCDSYMFTFYPQGFSISTIDSVLNQTILFGTKDIIYQEKIMSNAVIQRLSRIAVLGEIMRISENGLLYSDGEIKILIQF
jgi:hypothetical protein